MKTKILLAIVLVLFLACGFANRVEAGVTYPVVVATPTLSVVDLYGQTVKEDNIKRVEAFTQAAIKNGSPDYSGLGYESCVVNSDCLSGEQTCKAGIIPSSSSMPGYCVPNGK